MNYPILILAGIPAGSTAKMNRNYTFEWPGWDCRRCDTQSKKVDLSVAWRDVTTIVAEQDKDPNMQGVHVLAFHKVQSEQYRFLNALAPYHRIVFLPTSLLSLFSDAGKFNEALRGFVAFEERWRQEIRPSALSAPLLLPEDYFSAPAPYSQLWSNARAVTNDGANDNDRCAELRKAINQFQIQLHRQRETDLGYVDTAGRFFVYNGERHGRGKPGDNWKFTYWMEEGFHYDVSRFEGDGSIMFGGRKYGDHVNIYPHGLLR